MSATDISIVVLILGGLISIGFNLYQWWAKRGMDKIEKKRIIAATVAAEGTEANSMIGLAQLVVGFMNDFKKVIEDKFTSMEDKLNKAHEDLSQQIADHAAKDEKNIEEIKNEISKIVHA